MAVPKLIARFDTTPDGKPKFVDRAERGRMYQIVLEVENAPQDAYAATFELDPSYYDPYRTLVRDSDGRFRLSLPSDGKSDISVALQTKAGEIRLDAEIGDVLRRSLAKWPAHPQIDTGAVSEALEYIASH